MAFVRKAGSVLKQSGSKHVGTGLFSSNSPFFQAIRSISSTKLFVQGLSYGTDEMGLRQAFQQYGKVIEAAIIIDRRSGKSRGFGFVGYTSADAANTALQDMDGKELHGRRIKVHFAQEKSFPVFGSGGGGSYGGPGGGDGSNNLGLYGGRNQSIGRGGDLFGHLGDASRVSSGSGNEDDVDSNSNHDLSQDNGRDDFGEDNYADTSNK